MDINLFDFTAHKDDFTTCKTLPSNEKPRRRRKKQSDGQQEKTAKKLDPPPNKSKKASSILNSETKDRKVRTAENTNSVVNNNITFERNSLREVCEDKTENTVKDCSQTATFGSVDVVKVQKSPQRAGQLREKLLRLAPSNYQQNPFIFHNNKQADTQTLVPTLTVEAATESENEGEKASDITQFHSKGERKSNSDVEADADRQGDDEEEVLPDISSGSCTPTSDSQNSKYGLHFLTKMFLIQSCYFSLI